jgi:hypothetical protein
LACVYNKTRAAASLVLSSAFGQEAQVLLFECPRCSPDVNREAVAFNGLGEGALTTGSSKDARFFLWIFFGRS